MVMTVIPEKGLLLWQANFSTKRRWICKRRSLETISIFSIIIPFRSNNLFRNIDPISSLKGGKCFPKVFTGILKPVCMNVPFYLIDATLARAKSNTFAFYNSEFLYKNISVRYWYKVLDKNNSPHTAFF